jgi:hypothetical protein
MKDFDIKNIFLVSVVFGFNQKTHLVIANNKEEIKDLVEEIYYQPKIEYIISYNELTEIYQIMKNSKEFCLVIEMVREPNVNKLIHHYEIDQKLIDVKNKYLNKDCVFLNKEIMVEILKLFKEEMINSKNEPLISKLFKL